MRIDLNADIGESLDSRLDQVLMRAVTSVSIAAGGHAGDASTIRAALQTARSQGVAVGVHPSFADRQGFGRVEAQVQSVDVERLVLSQIEFVASIAADEGVTLQHVKPHGALYNMAARDAALAAAVAHGVASFDKRLLLVGPPHSHLLSAAHAAGLETLAEGFADRAYASDGSLVSRTVAGAVVTDPVVVVGRALRMVTDQQVVASDGTVLSLPVTTICLHSDTAAAAALAAAIRIAFETAGIVVKAPTR